MRALPKVLIGNSPTQLKFQIIEENYIFDLYQAHRFSINSLIRKL